MKINCLHVADIFGNPGLHAVESHLPSLISEHNLQVVTVNGENALDGKGISESICLKLFELGAQVITGGNHIWYNRKVFFSKNPLIKQNLIRPFNYPSGNPGRGFTLFETGNGLKFGVINMMGRTYMQEIDCPFAKIQYAIDILQKETKLIIVDFHAEASAEKLALAHYVDGRVSAVLGTHTHVQTADAQILPKGTCYITDVGMTGAHSGVIGTQPEAAIKRFILKTPMKMELATGKVSLNGALYTLDSETGHADSIENISISVK